MKPVLLIKDDSGTYAGVLCPPGAVMTGLVPVTHAARRVQAGGFKAQDPDPTGPVCLVGVDGRDKPGQDGADDEDGRPRTGRRR